MKFSSKLQKNRYFLILLIIIVFLFYTIIINRLLKYSSNELPNHLKVSSGYQLPSTASSSAAQPLTKGQFRVLLWTQYFGSNSWTRINLKDMNCSYSNCLLTDDRRHLRDSDAVFFHWRDLNNEDLPPFRRSNQKWVLYNWEPPHYTYEEAIKPLIDRIDWMMTYRRDSDIYVPYGSVQKCDRKWNSEDLFDKKTKSVAWIVSNCATPGDREGVVKALASHIDVDIYGDCGRYKCEKDVSCFQMIQNNYKFYLSFENSLCKDYVTEKLFRTIEYDIIPIVYGGADYKHILPNNSFIAVKDFPSIKQLSDYLKVVANDKQKYNSYLQWKRSHCVRQTEYRYFCDLCQKLNLNSVRKTVNESQEVVVQTARKGLDWWYKEADCQQKNTVYSINYSQLKYCLIITSLLFQFRAIQ